MSTTCYTCPERSTIHCRTCGRGYCKRCRVEHEKRETFESVIVDETTGKIINKDPHEHPSMCEAVPKEGEFKRNS